MHTYNLRNRKHIKFSESSDSDPDSDSDSENYIILDNTNKNNSFKLNKSKKTVVNNEEEDSNSGSESEDNNSDSEESIDTSSGSSLDESDDENEEEDSESEEENINTINLTELNKKNNKKNNGALILTELIKNIANKEIKKKKYKKLDKISKKKNKFKEKIKKLKYLTLTSLEYNYFKKLDIHNMKSNIDRIKEITKDNIIEPYLFKLANLNIDINMKKVCFNKLENLKNINPNDGEFNKLKKWLDSFFLIPFNQFTNLDPNINKSLDSTNQYILESKKILDQAVYGLDDAKLQILQLLGQLVVNPNSVGTSIAIHGPMGTGKTSLVKNGISKILNREFAFIPLGGSTDSSYLEGFNYTYEGSSYGKIIDVLIQCKSMNPLIYFDELDKVSDTPKGEEIIGILTHLIDITQNNLYQDKYFSELSFDLSKCLFIFSYNEENKVNKILRDRMYRISTKGYKLDEKLIISNNYLLPTIFKDINNNKIINIKMNDDIIKHIINKYTENEDGVRNLKRCLETIYSKLNLMTLIKKENNNLYNNFKIFDVNDSLEITNNIVDQLIISREQTNKIPFGMYT